MLHYVRLNVYGAANQLIRMISKGSCDTEDWSNDAKNSALPHRNKLYLYKIPIQKTIISHCNNISQYYCFYCIFFNQIYAALVSIKDLFEEHLKISLPSSNF